LRRPRAACAPIWPASQIKVYDNGNGNGQSKRLGEALLNELEKLAAIEEIKQLRARFARCMDTKQWLEMQDTITDDCEFDARDGSVVTELWHGAEDIVANIRRSLANAVSVHHAHMPEIEITSPTTAKGIWAMADLLRFPGMPTVDLVGFGHYIEGYEKQADGRWRLKTYQLTRLRVDVTVQPTGAPVDTGPELSPDKTIKAARLTGYGGPDKFSYGTVPEPIPGPGDILVKVAAAAVNPVDAKLRSGVLSLFMPMEFPAQLGGDVSGTVEAVGAGVTALKVGDRVAGMINPAKNGAYAEKIVAPAAAFVIVPEGLDLVDAAALPMGALTGVQLIELGVKAVPGQRILVTGATGSVGRAAVYTAAAAGALVVAGVRGHAKGALAGLPIAGVVDLGNLDDVAAAGPYDAIADTVGGRVAERLTKFIRSGGVLASVVSPPPLPPVNAPVSSAPVWVGFDGPRLTRFLTDYVRNRWSMPVAERLPLSEVAKAHALIDAGGVGGKILLVP
jgi:NADPH:quinone reductase-like Zn-dependent oxidoreductase